MTLNLNLAQRSFKAIDLVSTESAFIHSLIFLLVANSNLDPILHRFRDTAAEMSKIDIFPYPLVFRLKCGVFPLE